MTKGIYKNPIERARKISNSLKNHPCYKNSTRSKNISLSKKGVPNFKNRGINNGMYKENIVKNCVFCMKQMIGKPAIIQNKKYCSIKCQHNAVKGKTYKELYGYKKAKGINKKLIINGINMQKKQGGKISKAELKVKEYLEKKKINFISQYPYPIGIADFYLTKQNLIIECYGSYWHSKSDYIKRDKRQQNWLKKNGYNILILCSEDVLKNDKEVEKIWQNI